MAQGGWNLFGLGVGVSGSGTNVGTNAPLSPRQELSFNHLCDLYRPVRTYAGDGKPSAESWELAYVNVRCRVESKTNISELTFFGRLQGGQLVTLDLIHFAENQEVGDNWLFYNHSLRPDGAVGNLFGFFWMIRSISRSFMQSERREGGKKVFEASLENQAPRGLVVATYP